MALTTVTAKGQITIPKSVREALNLRSGDKVELFVEDDRAILKPSRGGLWEVTSEREEGILRRRDRHPGEGRDKE